MLTSTLLSAAFVFMLRIGDVSIGTIKLLYIVQGRRMLAAIFALFEASVWLVAAKQVFEELDNPVKLAAFAAGFAAGTAVGMTVERWIGSGYLLIRVVSKSEGPELLSALRDEGFGLTTIHGEGREGRVKVLMVVTRRKNSPKAIKLIQQVDPGAFVTVDSVSPVHGGYLFPPAIPSSIRK